MSAGKPKVLFIASTGGHLAELMKLRPIFSDYDFRIITEKTKNNLALRETYGKRVSYVIYGTKDHPLSYPFRLFANCWINLAHYLRFRPQVIVTTGAHIAGVMCCIGKLFGSKIIFIETYASVNQTSITGRLVYRIADVFVVQWEEMLKLYPNAVYFGGVF